METKILDFRLYTHAELELLGRKTLDWLFRLKKGDKTKIILNDFECIFEKVTDNVKPI